jgi:ABC-type polysaccharide transport system permease subunit
MKPVKHGELIKNQLVMEVINIYVLNVIKIIIVVLINAYMERIIVKHIYTIEYLKWYPLEKLSVQI